MPNNEFLKIAPKDYIWPQCPEADAFIRERLTEFLALHPFAKRLAERMADETSTELIAWTDHIVLPKSKYSEKELKIKFGYIPEPHVNGKPGNRYLYHPYADLPRVVLSSQAKCVQAALHVDRITDFLTAHHVVAPIQGTPYSAFRSIEIPDGKTSLWVIERRGTRHYLPTTKPDASDYLAAVEQWVHRPRRFKDEKNGMKQALDLAKQMAKKLGPAVASAAFLEAERIFWQNKNQAAQVQYARQQRLGLGWANHDHHTFRSSRVHFPGLISILLTFGFKKRERFYAGAESGWGAQVMEQPESGFIIFADVDLTPEERTVDFTKRSLPNLKKPATVGLWCALHGESILEAGLHHLEAQFDFDHLRDSLNKEHIGMMAPFSDMPHLRQAFTRGEMWPVAPERLEKLKKEGKISPEAVSEILIKGAVGSHLENLQRRNGFKGFNQRGVSDIIRDVHPENQALHRGAA